MKNNKHFGLGLIIATSAGLTALMISISLLMSISTTQAAPPAAPTPIANFVMPTKSAAVFPFQEATRLTGDTNTSAVEVMNLSALDISYTTVHTAAEVNTTTLTVQYSNDGTNWVNGVALATSNAAATTDISRVPVFGRWMRINQDTTNAFAVTVTLLAVGR